MTTHGHDARATSSRRALLVALLLVAVCGIGAVAAATTADVRRHRTLTVRSGSRTAPVRDAVVPRSEQLRAPRVRNLSLLAPMLGALCAVACRARRARREASANRPSSRRAFAVHLRAPPVLLPIAE